MFRFATYYGLTRFLNNRNYDSLLQGAYKWKFHKKEIPHAV